MKKKSGSPLEGKVALVTGGGIRLGRAIALALAEAGASVAVHAASSAKEAREVARLAGGDARAFTADLREPEQIARLFDEVDDAFGRLDLLVNNAGVFEKLPAADLTLERWRRMFSINVEAALLCSQAARLRMLPNGGGAIVNLADIAAARPWRGYAHYSASKAALVALTKSLAIEWAPEIRVNAVAPGAVLPPESSTQRELEKLAAGVPLGRLGDAGDVARAVLYLATEPYVTGVVLPVDGGRSLLR